MSTIEQAPEMLQFNPDLEVSAHHGLAIAGLGLVAVATHIAQVDGLIQNLPYAAQWVANSLKHPFLGELGAVICSVLTLRESRRVRAFCISTGVVVFNYGGEVAQTYITPVSEYSNFTDVRNMPETAKDLAFAFLGGGIFVWLERRKREKRSQTYTKNY